MDKVKATVLSLMLTCAIFDFVGCMSTDSIEGYTADKIESITSIKKIASKVNIDYRIYLPLDLEESNLLKFGELPLLVYLHGENHVDGVDEGLQKIIEYIDGEKNRAVLFAPICPKGSTWNDKSILLLVNYMVVAFTNSELVDDNRVYLTGFGDGGLGAWTYALSYPESITTVAPVCGGFPAWKTTPTPYVPEKVKYLNMWAVHYLADRSVTSDMSKKIIGQIWSKSTGLARYTEFIDGGHTAEIYGNRKFLGWIFASRRSYSTDNTK